MDGGDDADLFPEDTGPGSAEEDFASMIQSMLGGEGGAKALLDEPPMAEADALEDPALFLAAMKALEGGGTESKGDDDIPKDMFESADHDASALEGAMEGFGKKTVEGFVNQSASSRKGETAARREALMEAIKSSQAKPESGGGTAFAIQGNLEARGDKGATEAANLPRFIRENAGLTRDQVRNLVRDGIRWAPDSMESDVRAPEVRNILRCTPEKTLEYASRLRALGVPCFAPAIRGQRPNAFDTVAAEIRSAYWLTPDPTLPASDRLYMPFFITYVKGDVTKGYTFKPILPSATTGHVRIVEGYDLASEEMLDAAPAQTELQGYVEAVSLYIHGGPNVEKKNPSEAWMSATQAFPPPGIPEILNQSAVCRILGIDPCPVITGANSDIFANRLQEGGDPVVNPSALGDSLLPIPFIPGIVFARPPRTADMRGAIFSDTTVRTARVEKAPSSQTLSNEMSRLPKAYPTSVFLSRRFTPSEPLYFISMVDVQGEFGKFKRVLLQEEAFPLLKARCGGFDPVMYEECLLSVHPEAGLINDILEISLQGCPYTGDAGLIARRLRMAAALRASNGFGMRLSRSSCFQAWRSTMPLPQLESSHLRGFMGYEPINMLGGKMRVLKGKGEGGDVSCVTLGDPRTAIGLPFSLVVTLEGLTADYPRTAVKRRFTPSIYLEAGKAVRYMDKIMTFGPQAFQEAYREYFAPLAVGTLFGKEEYNKYEKMLHRGTRSISIPGAIAQALAKTYIGAVRQSMPSIMDSLDSRYLGGISSVHGSLHQTIERMLDITMNDGVRGGRPRRGVWAQSFFMSDNVYIVALFWEKCTVEWCSLDMSQMESAVRTKCSRYVMDYLLSAYGAESHVPPAARILLRTFCVDAFVSQPTLVGSFAFRQPQQGSGCDPTIVFNNSVTSVFCYNFNQMVSHDFLMAPTLVCPSGGLGGVLQYEEVRENFRLCGLNPRVESAITLPVVIPVMIKEAGLAPDLVFPPSTIGEEGFVAVWDESCSLDQIHRIDLLGFDFIIITPGNIDKVVGVDALAKIALKLPALIPVLSSDRFAKTLAVKNSAELQSQSDKSFLTYAKMTCMALLCPAFLPQYNWILPVLDDLRARVSREFLDERRGMTADDTAFLQLMETFTMTTGIKNYESQILDALSSARTLDANRVFKTVCLAKVEEGKRDLGDYTYLSAPMDDQEVVNRMCQNKATYFRSGPDRPDMFTVLSDDRYEATADRLTRLFDDVDEPVPPSESFEKSRAKRLKTQQARQGVSMYDI